MPCVRRWEPYPGFEETPSVKTSTPPASAVTTECGWCGEHLSPEEIEYPATDFRGDVIDDPICDQCFHEHYEFTCDRCEDYEFEEFSGVWVAVHEKTHGLYGPVERGIYEAVEWPIHGGPFIGEGYLYNTSLRKTPAVIDFESNYPCSYLCRGCAKELKLRHSRSGRQFHEERLAPLPVETGDPPHEHA